MTFELSVDFIQNWKERSWMTSCLLLILNLFFLNTMAAIAVPNKSSTQPRVNRSDAAAPIVCRLFRADGEHETQVATRQLSSEWSILIDAQSNLSIKGDLSSSTVSYREFTGKSDSEYSVLFQITCDQSLNCNATKTTKKKGKSNEIVLTIRSNGGSSQAFNQDRELFRYERSPHGFNYIYIQNHTDLGKETGFRVNCES